MRSHHFPSGKTEKGKVLQLYDRRYLASCRDGLPWRGRGVLPRRAQPRHGDGEGRESQDLGPCRRERRGVRQGEDHRWQGVTKQPSLSFLSARRYSAGGANVLGGVAQIQRTPLLV